MPLSNNQSHKWYLLALLTLTSTLVAAVPFSCMPVLFQEMSLDLGLDLVQIGFIWGISSLAGIFVSILGGVLSDKFSSRTVLTVFCILTGVTGALRGLSNDFFSLTATVFLNGMVRIVVPVAVTKSLGIWFKGPRLGMAQGIGAMGMGLGLMLGPLISATVLSPALGGWRNVMFFYGAISAFVGILWFIMGRQPPNAQTTGEPAVKVPLHQAFGKLIRLKELRLLGVTLMFRVGGLMGMTGYLPLYLKGKGWTDATADGALSLFYAMSTLFVIPLSFLSDKLGSRKAIMLPALVVSAVCIAMVPVAPQNVVWLLVVLAGMFMDSFMALSTTVLLETKGVGMEYTGMALGTVYTIAQVGSLASPPLGNALARFSTGLPFAFWSALSLAALVCFIFIKETGGGRIRQKKNPGVRIPRISYP